MSRYGQYGNYYDPVGSQSAQASGYTYQPPNSHLPNPSQTGAYQSNYQYGSDAQSSGNSANHAAAALSRLSNQSYSQSSWNRSNTPTQFPSSRRPNAGSVALSYRANNNAPPNQPNNWQMQQSQVPNVGTRHNMSGQDAASSNAIVTSAAYQNSSATRTESYQTSYAQRENQQPPRYNSPHEAFQAQQSHMMQNARWPDHNTAGRQQSGSVDPPPTTVNPSKVYDNRAELQRKAQIEAEKRRKQDAEQAAKKAEQDRVEAEKRKVDEEKRNAEEEKQKAEHEAARKAEQERKAEQRRKARADKKQSRSAGSALQKMSSVAPSSSAASEGENDEEAEMRAMFQKMREFNAKNPAMLAKLWEEERNTHVQEQVKATKSSHASPPPAPPQAAAAKPTPAPASSPAVRPASARKEPNEATEPTNKASAVPPRNATATPLQQPNTGIWPAHKKSYLADHTVKWLKAMSRNTDNPITPETVFNILERNPSYVQLCEALEELGLKFDRGSLARVLLSAGPSTFKMESSKRAQGAASTSETVKLPADLEHQKVAYAQANSIAGAMVYEIPQSLSQPLPGTNGSDQRATSHPLQVYGGTMLRATQSPYFAPPQPVGSGGRRASQSQPPEVKEDGKPAEPSRPPADKEEAARKRTFGDLVDLTAEDSDDDEPPPKRTTVSQEDHVPAPQSGTAPTFVTPQSFRRYVYQSPWQNSGSLPQVSNFAIGPSKPSWGQQLAQPNAVPSNHYPTPAPPPPLKPKGPTLEQQQTSRMRGKMLVEPMMRDRVARKSKYDSRTIARDVLLATGRHPDMRSLNGHLVTMQKLLGQHGGDPGGITGEGNTGHERGSRSDLGTIRWSIIDPEPLKDDEAEKDREVPVHDDARGELAQRVGKKEAEAPLRLVEYEASIGKPSAPTPPAQTSEEKAARRRGRPPKNSVSAGRGYAKDLGKIGEASAPRPSTAGTSTSTSRHATPSTPAPLGQRDSMSSSTPVGYAAFRKYNDDGTEIKRRGRPVGWKKSIHSREAQGLPPKNAPSLPNRSKQQQSGVKPAQTEPQYQVYRCGWQGCKAELHNLETLKKHVIKLHATKSFTEDDYECLWKSCVTAEAERQEGPKSFDTIEKWASHVDSKHLAPMAWKLGDGPKADFSALRYDTSQDIPIYLLDREGRSVTPIISPTPPPSTAVPTHSEITKRQSTSASPAPQQARPVGRPPKDGIPRAQRESGIDAPLRRLQEQKRIIGPTMDRMGCIMADEGRRRGFLDDEDFEDEVSGSEYG